MNKKNREQSNNHFNRQRIQITYGCCCCCVFSDSKESGNIEWNEHIAIFIWFDALKTAHIQGKKNGIKLNWAEVIVELASKMNEMLALLQSDCIANYNDDDSGAMVS